MTCCDASRMDSKAAIRLGKGSLRERVKALGNKKCRASPANSEEQIRSVPDGHPKLLHLWPPKLPQAGRPNYQLFSLTGSDFLSW